MKAIPYQQLRDELFTPEQQMENEAAAKALIQDQVAPIECKPCTKEEAHQMVEDFFHAMETGGGTDLRGEHRTNLNGRRLVFVFDWDDMG